MRNRYRDLDVYEEIEFMGLILNILALVIADGFILLYFLVYRKNKASIKNVYIKKKPIFAITSIGVMIFMLNLLNNIITVQTDYTNNVALFIVLAATISQIYITIENEVNETEDIQLLKLKYNS